MSGCRDVGDYRNQQESLEEEKSRTVEKLGWKVHTVGLFREILGDPQCSSLKIPLNILLDLLKAVAQRATELHDPDLDKLMIRLALYSIANPDDPEYNPDLVRKILGEGDSP